MWRDVRYGLRSLQRAPGFAIVAVVVLALGIGVNTATFSIINAVLLRPLPISDPDRVAFIYSGEPEGRPMVAPHDACLQLASGSEVFVAAGASRDHAMNLKVGADVERLTGEIVSTNYFSLLGVAPAIGRGFDVRDEASDAPRVIVISHSLWQRRLSADSNPIGRTIWLAPTWEATAAAQPHVVVGVMAADFAGVSSPFVPTDVWKPAVQSFEFGRVVLERIVDLPMTVAIARLQPGVTMEQARAAATVWAKRIDSTQGVYARRSYPRVVLDSRRVTLPFDARRTTEPSRLGAGLMAVAGLVLIIGITNLAGVVMARGVGRRGELAVLLTLGASRWRVARQLVIESLLLSAVGGLAGVILSRVFVTVMLQSMPGGVPGAAGFVRQAALGVPIDLTVLLFSAALSLSVGLAIGFVQLRGLWKADLLQPLSGSSSYASRRTRTAFRHWIVIPQICVSLALLVAAGVAVRSLLRVALVAPGYEPARAVVLEADVPTSPAARSSEEQRAAFEKWREGFFARLIANAETQPGVEAVALTTTLPTVSRVGEVITEQAHRQGGATGWTSSARITPGYFDALGIPVVAGRTLDRGDLAAGSRVAVIDESFAATFWPGKSPLGERFAFRSTGPSGELPPEWLEVIGVVGTVRGPLSEGQARPFVYTPLTALPRSTVMVVARGSDTPQRLIATLRTAVEQSDASVGIISARTLDAVADDMRYPRRIAAGILGFGGLIGLLLASTGLYGVVSYSVAQRFRELGIRAALGAGRRDITTLVIREAGRAVAVGVALGTALAYVALRVAASRFVAIGELDAVVMIGAPLALTVVVLLACYLPASRAARVDPVQVLRSL